MSKFQVPNGKADYYLYFLRCEKGFYYIGISQNLYHRLKQHKQGAGSVVTRNYRPIELMGVWELGNMTYQEAEMIEDEFTAYFITRYGDRVRGGHWSKVKENVKQILKNNPGYNPCGCYQLAEMNFMFEKIKHPHKKKRPKHKLRFKSRAEKVEWICKGKPKKSCYN